MGCWKRKKGIGKNWGNLDKLWTSVNNNVPLLTANILVKNVNNGKLRVGCRGLSKLASQFSINLKLFLQKLKSTTPFSSGEQDSQEREGYAYGQCQPLPHCSETEKAQLDTTSITPDFSTGSRWKVRQPLDLGWGKGIFLSGPPLSKTQTRCSLG